MCHLLRSFSLGRRSMLRMMITAFGRQRCSYEEQKGGFFQVHHVYQEMSTKMTPMNIILTILQRMGERLNIFLADFYHFRKKKVLLWPVGSLFCLISENPVSFWKILAYFLGKVGRYVAFSVFTDRGASVFAIGHLETPWRD